jgi:cyclic nucleotide-binding domain protein
MPAQFNSYIDRIDTDFWKSLCIGQGEMRRYEKGDKFISAGTVGRYIGYIKSGALKYVCLASDGTPHVVGLEFAGHFVCDFPGSLYRQKSRCSIIATVPCEIYCIPSSYIADRMPSDARLREIIEATTREIFCTLYDRHIDLYSKSPKERYDQLISNDPNLFSLFSLKDIASLLNITPTHLSRIRKNQ